MIQIRELHPRELEAPDMVRLLSLSIYDPARAPQVAASYAREARRLIGAWEGPVLAGLIGLEVRDAEVEVLHLAVRKDLRGRNIGRRLLTHAAALFRSLPLGLETDRGGVPFYEKCGFSVEPLGEKYPGTERFRCTLRTVDGPDAARERPELRFEELPLDSLDQIKPLWEALNRHHAALSTGWKESFTAFTFSERCRKLTSGGKRVRIDVARNAVTGQIAGYCISSIAADRSGGIDSLFVSDALRGLGAGKRLAQAGLDWLEREGASDVTIVVAEGNEDALPFYARLGFVPRAIHLKRPAGSGGPGAAG
jgi:ribosomal protein S18 acetylase RimI-like enzyme